MAVVPLLRQEKRRMISFGVALRVLELALSRYRSVACVVSAQIRQNGFNFETN
jgi:hypothetical protein